MDRQIERMIVDRILAQFNSCRRVVQCSACGHITTLCQWMIQENDAHSLFCPSCWADCYELIDEKGVSHGK